MGTPSGVVGTPAGRVRETIIYREKAARASGSRPWAGATDRGRGPARGTLDAARRCTTTTVPTGEALNRTAHLLIRGTGVVRDVRIGRAAALQKLAMPLGIAALRALHRFPSRASLTAHSHDSADYLQGWFMKWRTRIGSAMQPLASAMPRSRG